jgi:hypothetical protein
MTGAFSGTFVSNPLWIAILIACAGGSGAIASHTGRKFRQWFFGGLLFGPLTLIVIILLVVFKGNGESE